MEDKIQKIEAIEQDLLNRKSAAEARLRTCQEELPALLAGMFMDEVTEGEVGECKRRLKEQEEIIQDVPLAFEGLRARKAEIHGQLAAEKKASDRRKAESRYEKLKAQIADSVIYDRNLDGDFRSTAARIGKREEADAFINKWQYRIEQTKGV